MTGPTSAVVREAVAADAPALAEVHRRSRAVAMPWLPVPHDEAAARAWSSRVVLVEQRVVVAEERGAVLRSGDVEMEVRVSRSAVL
ncbi:hypothetical protein [uncultured Pseudokineococcus sp.]|uniref:hypothetical protein n=1 Tax=uncultured Pseudokineococcus sp. TaxID=1642928 RepID=UPI002628ADD0|nr:hypothetical protein [uncultured Pseudokineococcus sp.]